MYRFDRFFIHPCGECEYECFRDGAACPHYSDKEAEILEAISESNETIFIVPNYCDHPCANFFIFNERSNCWFQGRPDRLLKYMKVNKKFIVISNTECQSFVRAFEQHTESEPDILYLSAKQHGFKSSTENLLQCEEIRRQIGNYLEEIVESA